MERFLVVFATCLLGALAAEKDCTFPCSLPPSPCSTSDNDTGTMPTLNSELQRLAGMNDTAVHAAITYDLEAGEHCVRNFFLVQNLESVSFNGPANISCLLDNGLAFLNITDLHFSDLTIDGCGLNLDNVQSILTKIRLSIAYFFVLSESFTDQYVAVILGNCHDVHMEYSNITNNKGLGLLGINIMGTSIFDNLLIEQNVPMGCFDAQSSNATAERVGGGALFSYHDYNTTTPSNSAYLNITNSEFLENSYCGLANIHSNYYLYNKAHSENANLLIGGGGGLSLILSQLRYRVNIAVSHSTFRNNTGIYGGGAHVDLYAGALDSSVLFENCIFDSNGIGGQSRIVGSALLLVTDIVQPTFNLNQIDENFSISKFRVFNSSFVNNSGSVGTVAVLSLHYFVPPMYSNGGIVLEQCIFKHNSATIGPGLFIQEYKNNYLQPGTDVILRDVEFSHNMLYSETSLLSPVQATGTLVVIGNNLTLSGNTKFFHNEGTAVLATTTVIQVTGNVTFLNNSGSYGGALSLSQGSLIIIGRNATMGFYNNSGAVVGGAIYVSALSLSSSGVASIYDCFLYFGPIDISCSINKNCDDVTKFDAKLKFEGNLSPIGNMIYGATLNSCPWTTRFRETYAPDSGDTNLLELFYAGDKDLNYTSPFDFDSKPETIQTVSTPTTLLTVQSPDENQELNASIALQMAPGIRRPLFISSLDSFKRDVPSAITSLSQTDSTASQIGGNNYHFLNRYDNSSSIFTDLLIYSSQNRSNVRVSVFAISTFTQVSLLVNMTNCPDGFIFSDESNSSNDTPGRNSASSQQCKFRQNLADSNLASTEDGQIIVPYGQWIGRSQDNVLYFGDCPLYYCKPEFVVVPVNNTISNPDEFHFYDIQCNYNYSRGGMACGSCVEGYSTMFGSNRCRECSNYYLVLILLFGAYGIFLIAFIMFFQFTISEGFLNGIIFFSNILSVYAPYFLNSKLRLYFLVFYWLSLKIGFEICFFDGMTALSGIALNFVFPLYLYLLLVLIILFARWSPRFSRWLGTHGCSPIKLFATILVMTYSSLLETCIAVLSFTRLRQVESNHPDLYWTYDASVKYFHGLHGALSTFSIILLLFFLIPAPYVWLFPDKVYNSTRLQKYKPLYDAVWAPLKPKFRFWVSLRLIMRAIPLTIINFAPIPINLLLLCFFLLLMLFLHSVIQPFQLTSQNGLDSLFQVKLIGIALSSLYFTVLNINLGQNGLVNDVDIADVEATNNVIQKADHSEFILIAFLAVMAYLSLSLAFVWHLILRFPKFRWFCIRIWNYVVCKRCQRKQRSRGSSSGYNAGDAQDETESVTSGNVDEDSLPKRIVTFSELREPLLETSGVANIHQIYT